MAYATATAVLESAETTGETRWTLRRETGGEWCFLSCTSGGWKLSMHDGGYTVVAESSAPGQPDVDAVDALRSRLRALGWNDEPAVRLRLKAERRRGRQNLDDRTSAGSSVQRD